MISKFFLPARVVFGTGVFKQLQEYLTDLGGLCLIVYGRSSAQRSGLLDRALQSLKQAGKRVELFGGVPPEPDVKIVNHATMRVCKLKPDFVIGLGGGSVIDVAKAAAGLAREPNFTTVADFLEGCGMRKLDVPGIPFVAIPTVAGTGAEVTKNSVIVKHDTREKRSLRSDLLFARFAIVDPETTVSVPASITAESGFDGLAHLIEGYVSRWATPLTDALAEYAISLMSRSLLKCVREPGNIQARSDVSLAALIGGIMIANSGLGIAHGIGSFLGGMFGVRHGVVCALLLPYVMKFNQSYAKQKFSQLDTIFGGNCVKAVRQMCRDTGIPQRLRDIGIKEENLSALAKASVTASSTKGNPRQVSELDVLKFLKSAL